MLTVADSGAQEITKHECLAELGPQYLRDHNGDPVKFYLRACDCSANEGILPMKNFIMFIF